ncbi:conserved Plasmodium protein, unknown function, partial [Plasmodium malariae]
IYNNNNNNNSATIDHSIQNVMNEHKDGKIPPYNIASCNNAGYNTASVDKKEGLSNICNMCNINKEVDDAKIINFCNVCVGGKEAYSCINKNLTNELCETADFGCKENSDTYEFRNDDNTIRIISGNSSGSRNSSINNNYNNNNHNRNNHNNNNHNNNNHNNHNNHNNNNHNNYHLQNGEMVNGNNLRQCWFDYMNRNINNISADDIKSMLFHNNTQSVKKENGALPIHVFSKDGNDEALNEFIIQQIKGSVSDVIEKMLNSKQKNVLQKINDIGVERNRNANESFSILHGDTSGRGEERYNLTSCTNCPSDENDHFEGEREQEQRKGMQQRIRKRVQKENEQSKDEETICTSTNKLKCGNSDGNNEDNNGLNNRSDGKSKGISSPTDEEKVETECSYNQWGKVDYANAPIEGGEIVKKEENIDISNDNMVKFNDEDYQEINKLNNHLKMSKVSKRIEIKKDELENKYINWKNILYNCIDIIYYLTNENNKKNNKMNSLLSEINNINEYEKKIEYLNKENEKLRVEIVQKNETIKMKDIKERTNLNNKITEQLKKITSYEKDINIYKNKINKLNNKIIFKDNEVEKVTKQYHAILDEIEKCKKDANNVVKKMLNKKSTNLMDKQCLDISKYYEIQISTLNKEVKSLRDLVKSEAKEKIILTKRVKLLELRCGTKKGEKAGHNSGRSGRSESRGSERSGSSKSNRSDTSSNNIRRRTKCSGCNISDKEDEVQSRKKGTVKKKPPGDEDCAKLSSEERSLKKNKSERGISSSYAEKKGDEKNYDLIEEGKYKRMYQNLVEELNEMKKDFENQNMLHAKKIEQLEQHQEIQNIKNQLNASEKIVEVYQNIFRENVNYIKNDNLHKIVYNNETIDEFSSHGAKKNSYINVSTCAKDSCNLTNTENVNSSTNVNTNINGNMNTNRNNYDYLSECNNLFIQNTGIKINGKSYYHNLTNSSGSELTKKVSHLYNDTSKLLNLPYDISSSLVNAVNNNGKVIENNNYLNDFVKMYIENTPMDELLCDFKNDINELKKQNKTKQNNYEKIFDNNSMKVLFNNLMNYEKVQLINIFVDICSDLKTDNIFVIVQFVKFLSFIVYRQFPLFTSFYYDVASIVSTNSAKFDECINIIKKWKSCYINGQKYHIFRRNVLLIFQSDLKNVKKSEIDNKCMDIMKTLYRKNLEMSKYSNDSFEKAEYILNKHSKEIISKIIKTYMNLYNIEKISNIISHMNSMNSKVRNVW